MAEQPESSATGRRGGGILDLIEWLGNKLPDPVMLFLGCAVAVMILSAVGASMGWTVQPRRPQVVMETVTNADGSSVQKPKLDERGKPVIELVNDGAPIQPRSLLSGEGIYWAIVNMVRNFINFAPLGVVLTGMLGIGLAEKVGLFGAFMKWMATIVPSKLLTPTIIFLGVMSSVASDAGYIVLPPLAAALYIVFGRPPIAGIAAAFAGVAAGFSANLLISAGDAVMSELTTRGAHVLDRQYSVLPTANWYFMIASTFLLTFVGWAVTAWVIEPRFAKRPPEAGGPVPREAADQSASALSASEARGLRWAGVSAILAVAGVLALIVPPGAPLNGPMPVRAPAFGAIPNTPPSPGVQLAFDGELAGDRVSGAATVTGRTEIPAAARLADGSMVAGTFVPAVGENVEGTFARSPKPPDRWTQAIVPIILFTFVVPGLVYGFATGALRSQADVGKAFIYAMQTMAPIIALAFFAAQFIEYLSYSRLDRMLAYFGGGLLVDAGLPKGVLLVGVVFLTMAINLFIGSMSAKWTMLAPILVPMLMMVGVSPELTQASYRVGDSVTNIVTPLNSYLLIILVVMQRYWKTAGMGTLIATMVPYSVAFLMCWIVMLLVWSWLGIPLGPGAGLLYVPAP